MLSRQGSIERGVVPPETQFLHQVGGRKAFRFHDRLDPRLGPRLKEVINCNRSGCHGDSWRPGRDLQPS